MSGLISSSLIEWTLNRVHRFVRERQLIRDQEKRVCRLHDLERPEDGPRAFKFPRTRVCVCSLIADHREHKVCVVIKKQWSNKTSLRRAVNSSW
jgi:hypothetical protein